MDAIVDVPVTNQVRALGRYELIRPLARGGMAEVYLARRRAAGIEKLLVVKRIRPERTGDVRFLELFMREARLSMGLTHGNIVPVFDFGRAGDQVFLAMEWVEGRDLGSSLARAASHRLPPLCAAFVAAECCQGLAYAHDRKDASGASLGVVHRDVTPRNVLVAWSGEVKLTDFGIAGLAGDRPGQVVGTPGYLAPEQARGEATDPRADVYAVGVVLREALTGQRLRPGDERDGVLALARAGTRPPWPTEVELDPALVAIVDRATAPAPADRFADAHALGAALDEWLVAERAAVRGPAPGQQLAAWMAEVWGEERDAPAVGAIPGGAEFASFLDDGALGTGTARSLVATAADHEPPPATAAASPSIDALASTVNQPSPTTPAPSPSPTSPSPRAPRRRAAMIGLGAAAVALAGALVVWPRIRPAAVAPGDRADATPLDAAPLDAAPLDAAPLDAAATDDAALATDAAATDGPSPTPRDGGRPLRPRPADAGATAPDAAAPRLRTVRINARPWALVTVDGGGPPRETIATFQLAPGPHRVHFANPALGVERTVTIDVPADRDYDFVLDLRP